MFPRRLVGGKGVSERVDIWHVPTLSYRTVRGGRFRYGGDVDEVEMADDDDLMFYIGRATEAQRRLKRMTQANAAARAGLSERTYRKVEYGEGSSLLTLASVAEALGLRLSELVDLAERMAGSLPDTFGR